MFARIKKSGQYQYLQIVENRREGTKTIQRVISTIGRMDRLHVRGEIENLARSLSRFSEKVLLILSGKSNVNAYAKKIGPSLIFEWLWKELGIGKIIRRLLLDLTGFSCPALTGPATVGSGTMSSTWLMHFPCITSLRGREERPLESWLLQKIIG